MGLLSDPEAGHSKWAHFLIKYHRPFCFLLCISAYVWFCLLAHKSFNNGNSYSENALLPGLVRSEFVDDGTAKRLFNELNDEVKENYETRDALPIPWLAAKMRQMNLDVYSHNFTLKFPLGTKEKFQGENVYGILRAGRSASTEALVISAPYRPLSSHDKTTNAGIALMLAMAKFARSRKYWSKDLIFLVTAHEQLGAQAWLQAYHHTHSDWLDAGDLKGRAGAIQAAINLEMSTLSVKYIEVKVEGLNGQLPNLDLVTLVHKMCVQSSVPHAYKNSFSWTPRTTPWKTWLNSFNTLIAMVTTQVTGVPTGNHGLFHRYGIEAVTLMSAGKGGGGGRPAHALEASLRSLNNLLERFHQSYFFYLRTGTDRFLSISQYMPPLGLLVAALFIRAFALWLTSQKQENAKTCDNKESKDCSEGDTMATNQEISDIDEDSADESGDKLAEKECCDGLDCDNHDAESTPNHLNLMNLLITFLVIHTIGYAVMSSPPFISVLGVKKFALLTEEALFYGLSAFSVISVLVLPRLFNSLMSPNPSGTAVVGGESAAGVQQRSLLIVALLELATLVLAVGMHNFSLGFCLAAVYAPVGLMVAVGGARSQLGRHVTKFLWLLLHPQVLSMLVVFCYTKLSFPEEGFKELMGRGLDASKHAIIFSVVDGMIYGNWLFNIVTLILLPIWIMFWQILNFKG